ncbi:MAG TPA: flavin monoamine oxidase family protein [Candidatus Dormibacteraeota bacterium]|jgi:monoamine oxidase
MTSPHVTGAVAPPDNIGIIEDGLQPRSETPKRVIVVGAGMAGLVAAYELLRAGHEPLILEGRSRVGGRILTLREPFAPGLHAEAGAMRLPKAHHLVMGYVAKFGLPLVPFTMGNPNAYYHICGRRYRVSDVHAEPRLLSFSCSEAEADVTASQLWQTVLAPLVHLFEGRTREQAWEEVIARYDRYSTREFLKEAGWSEEAIERFGVLENQESRMNASFVELLLQEIGEEFLDMWQIEGGMDRLPLALASTLQDRIRYGASMVALDQSPDLVTVHYRNAAGRHLVSGDHAIITVPFSVLRHTEVLQPFSPGKRQAIRELHYDASTKIFLQCRRRFWEDDDGIRGGGSVTDLAIRNVYYPDHGRETGRGVIIGSYTWADDAQRWASLSESDRVTEALEDVSQIHPQVLQEFEVGASKVWQDDPFSCGAFALFNPDQKTLLHEHIIAPEGRIHFAGEHASLNHRWIQGAVDSGLRAAREVHMATLAAV